MWAVLAAEHPVTLVVNPFSICSVFFSSALLLHFLLLTPPFLSVSSILAFFSVNCKHKASASSASSGKIKSSLLKSFYLCSNLKTWKCFKSSHTASGVMDPDVTGCHHRLNSLPVADWYLGLSQRASTPMQRNAWGETSAGGQTLRTSAWCWTPLTSVLCSGHSI